MCEVQKLCCSVRNEKKNLVILSIWISFMALLRSVKELDLECRDLTYRLLTFTQVDFSSIPPHSPPLCISYSDRSTMNDNGSLMYHYLRNLLMQSQTLVITPTLIILLPLIELWYLLK